jgi:hypothetical protein
MSGCRRDADLPWLAVQHLVQMGTGRCGAMPGCAAARARPQGGNRRPKPPCPPSGARARRRRADAGRPGSRWLRLNRQRPVTTTGSRNAHSRHSTGVCTVHDATLSLYEWVAEHRPRAPGPLSRRRARYTLPACAPSANGSRSPLRLECSSAARSGRSTPSGSRSVSRDHATERVRSPPLACVSAGCGSSPSEPRSKVRSTTAA